MNFLKSSLAVMVISGSLISVPEMEAEAAVIAVVCKSGMYQGVSLDPTLWCEGSWSAGGSFGNFFWTRIRVLNRTTQLWGTAIRSAEISPPQSGNLPDAVLSCNVTASVVVMFSRGNLWHWIPEPFSFEQVGEDVHGEKEISLASSGHSSCNGRF